MYLFLLSCETRARYDFYDSHIIAADSEAQARYLAAKASADEGPEVWITASCQIIGAAAPDSELGIVLSSFNAG